MKTAALGMLSAAAAVDRRISPLRVPADEQAVTSANVLMP